MTIEETKRPYQIVDLTTIDPNMEGNWWHHIDGVNFGFRNKVDLIRHHRVQEGDVLLHKYKNELAKFPDKHWFFVVNNQVLELSLKDIKTELAKSMVNWIFKYKQLPYACSLNKINKKETAWIDYSPNKWDNICIIITSKMLLKQPIEDFDAFAELLKTLKPFEKNPFDIHSHKNTSIPNVENESETTEKSKTLTTAEQLLTNLGKNDIIIEKSTSDKNKKGEDGLTNEEREALNNI